MSGRPVKASLQDQLEGCGPRSEATAGLAAVSVEIAIPSLFKTLSIA
jgi:hypothetical protein